MGSRKHWLILGGVLGLALGLGCRDDFQEECPEGQETCPCVGGEDGSCLEGLICSSGVCVEGSGSETQADSEAESNGESSTSGDGDGETTGGLCDGPSGSTAEGSENANMLTGSIHARQIEVDCNGRLVSVALHSPLGISLLVRAAVYADDGGVPGALLANTGADSNPGGGWMSLPSDDVVLEPGTYWVAFMVADAPGGELAAFSWEPGNSGVGYEAPASWGDPPAFFPDNGSPTARGWSAYMVLEAP